MRTQIGKEQTKELSRTLNKLKVPQTTIDELLSSQNAANTYKAYKQKKKIQTKDHWTIHFGANWAKSDKAEEQPVAKKTVVEEVSISAEPKPEAVKDVTEPAEEESAVEKTINGIKNISKGLVSKIIPKEASKDNKTMKKVALEIEKEQLMKLKELADAEGIPVSSLVRLAIRQYLG